MMGVSVLRAQAPSSQSQPEQASPSTSTEKQENQQKQKKQQQPPTEAPSKPGELRLTTPELTTPQLTTPKPEAPGKPGPKGQAPPASPKKEVLVEGVEFRGNRRIPSSSLQAQIFTRPGDVYNVDSLERDFMALWNTGYFDDIRLEA
ncbi:MAG TPA: POTRA domain-containing protein, partial [Terriglobia bacterium]|nr:POTRA domain-containing protein [Terriglobia bacterium]